MRRAAAPLLLMLASVLASLVIGEGVLRLCGRGAAVAPIRRAGEPVMFEPDPVLGWRNRPGHYRYDGYTKDAPPITVTVWPSRQRATAPERQESGNPVWLLGCSYTFGLAVSDEETFAWRLQAAWPARRIENYGTAAYGTYQALLTLRRLVSAPVPPDTLVVYVFHPDHERRNVATYDWLRTVQTGRQTTAPIPFVSLGPDGALRERRPVWIPTLPLRTRSATVAAVEEVWLRAVAGSPEDGRPATQALIREMAELTRQHGARFAVAVLDGSQALLEDYTAALAPIDVVDCRQRLDLSLRVPGEGHPNGTAHAHWADCLRASLGALAGRGERSATVARQSVRPS